MVSTHRRSLRSVVLGAALSVLMVPALAAPASAESLLDTTLSSLGTLDRSCFARTLTEAAGVETQTVTAPGPGMVSARLVGDESDDWDVAVTDSNGRVVAGSAGFGSDEVAQGYVLEGGELTVRACRLSGAGDAQLTTDFSSIEPSADAQPAKLVKVVTPTRADKERLQTLGLDLTEHGGEDFVSVVLYGRADARTLERAGFRYVVDVPDLAARSERDAAADLRFARAHASSSLPSGRTGYRRLFDYNEEMKRLAERNPNLVKPFTLPFKTYEGRSVHGIEITKNVDARDGKPVFLNMGLHHAREWPSGEHALEWAYELVKGYRDGRDRHVNLVTSVRTIIVPVVNPDGFNISREAGQVLGAAAGRAAPPVTNADLAQVAVFPYEYWRKNCRFLNGADGGRCFPQQPPSGLAHPGVDPNRNYGGMWGGPGASTDPTSQSYRGPTPFSEPETQNIRHLVSTHQVTMLLTNHTYSNLWLRPPGQAESPDSPDEDLYEELGARMTAENGYSNIPGFQLYDTSGTTEDWSYWTAGGFGFTPEIGCEDKEEGSEGCLLGNFHGPYGDQVIDEYRGRTVEADEDVAEPGDSGGNRNAYFIAQGAARDLKTHSIIKGKAPKDAVLRIKKKVRTGTFPDEDQSFFPDRLTSSMAVPSSGKFAWHINPSTSPIVAQQTGREAKGVPSPPKRFSGGPGPSAQPCANYDTTDPNCWNDHSFRIPKGPRIDNAKATVRMAWPTSASDWDMKIFRDSNGDGSSAGESQLVTASGQGGTTSEKAIFVEPRLEAGKKYVVRAINWAAAEPYTGQITFSGPDEFKPADAESWQLTCERDGEVVSSQQLFIERGERRRVRGLCQRDD